MDRKWVVRRDSELLPVEPQGVETNSLRKGLHNKLGLWGRQRKSRAVAHQREGLVSRVPLVKK